MANQLQEVIAATPTAAAELLAGLFRLASKSPLPQPPAQPVKLEFRIKQASALYLKLYGIPPARLGDLPGKPRSDPARLFQLLDAKLRVMPATDAEFGVLELEVLPHEARYLRRVLANNQRDVWRKTGVRRAYFTPLEAVEIAEEEGGRASLFGPSHPESPDGFMRQALIRTALDELPEVLKVQPELLAALLAGLMKTDGNVSELARQLGQGQRKTARQVARIRAYLKKRAFSL